jgi:alginate O-acetyltransferase complex protein AlgJ
VTVTGPPRSIPPVHESWLPREHSLYRPRHGTQRLALACALVFFFLPGLLLVVAGPSQTNENRRLAGFPSIADGWGFLTGLDPWASDHLAFKSQALDVSNWISRGIFGEPPRFNRDVQGPVAGPVAPQPPPPRPANPNPDLEPDPQQTGVFPQVLEGRSGWLYLGFDSQGKCQPSQSLDEIVANLQRLRQGVEQSGRKFVLVVAPDKSTVVPDYLPRNFGGKECAAKARTQFWSRMVTELGVVDLRPALQGEAVRIGRPTYFQQDTHWTFAGGLTMTRAIADRIQPGRSDRWRVTDGPRWTGPADLPTLLGSSGENDTNRYLLAPDGNGDRTKWINSDFRTPLSFQSSPVDGMLTTRTAMIADSYTQFASGYLAATFSEISITHVESLMKDTQGVADRLANAETVVVEVVERHLSAGVSPITNPAYLNPILATLAARPLR